jgi:hypothetical protein
VAESIEHYARSVEQILREHKVLQQLKKELRKPIFAVRKAIKANALATLPEGGGLNEWVAAAPIKAKTTFAGERITVHISAGRDSQGGRSDLKRIDAGKVRHPTWGRRTKGSWSLTTVTPGFFTKPATESKPWTDAADAALDKALEGIR